MAELKLGKLLDRTPVKLRARGQEH